MSNKPVVNRGQADKESFTLDVNGKRARRVTDSNTHDKLDAIIAALGGDVGVPRHFQDQRQTTIGPETTVITTQVPATKTAQLKKVTVTCRQSVKFRVLVEGVEIGSGRTAPGNPNVSFTWGTDYEVQENETIEVKVQQTIGKVSDIESYLTYLEN